MMVRLFVLFPSLAFTPHRDRCPIIPVNDAGDAGKSERAVLLFLFLISVISPIFWGVGTVVPLSALVPAPVGTFSPTSIPYSGLSYRMVVSYSRWGHGMTRR